MSPQDLAARRLAAIESIQAQLAGHLSDMERELLEGLLSRLQDIQADPAALAGLLDEFTQAVHLPVLQWAGQALLQLPALTVEYFGALGVASADYEALRAPLQAYLQTAFGLTADGTPRPGGLLYTYAGDQTVKRELLAFGYRALTSGAGLVEYRTGLTQLVTGGADSGGLYTRLHQSAYDLYNQADRVAQGMGADALGFDAALYQGGLIASSRAFCKVRNGKVFLRSEIAKFGTRGDAYGGYTNKAAGEFSGKPDAYQPLIHLGGYSCRHGLSYLPNLVAMQLRPELGEDAQGRLIIKPE